MKHSVQQHVVQCAHPTAHEHNIAVQLTETQAEVAAPGWGVPGWAVLSSCRRMLASSMVYRAGI